MSTFPEKRLFSGGSYDARTELSQVSLPAHRLTNDPYKGKSLTREDDHCPPNGNANRDEVSRGRHAAVGHNSYSMEPLNVKQDV